MPIASKITLLAVMALAAMAIAATPASATPTPLEASIEGGAHCPDVTVVGDHVEGGCIIHAVTEGGVELSGHLFGIEQHEMRCFNEYTAHLDENATGYLTGQSLTGSSCNREPCDNAPAHEDGTQFLPWPAAGFEAEEPPIGPGGEYLEVSYCIENHEGDIVRNCTVSIPFATTHDHDSYEFLAVDQQGHTQNPRCELTGHWDVENTGVIISHT